MAPATRKAEAANAKEASRKAELAMRERRYDAALVQYTVAIEAEPRNHTFYANRSGAHAAKGSFKEALLDADKCIELKGDRSEGYSRRGAAYAGLEKYSDAQASYERGLQLEPSSNHIKKELDKLSLRRYRQRLLAGNRCALQWSSRRWPCPPLL